MIGIYKITSPSNKVYIGSSKNIEKRIQYYYTPSCKNQIKLYNSIKKYGWDSHEFEILEECSFEDLYKRERYYGELFNVLGENGLNLMLPKDDENKVGISEETRKKMSESKKGEKGSFYGKKHTEENKQKQRERQLGRKHTEEHRRKVSLNNAKNMAKIVLDLNTGIFYESAKEASEYYGIKHSTLRSMLNGTNRNNSSLIYA